LFDACRSNVERRNERLPDSRYDDSRYDAPHHFRRVWAWDGPTLSDEVAARVPASRAPLGGEQGLLLDEGGGQNAGTPSVGGARQ
jgi:hypothetical protein